jgi:two-component system cell cycle sensor histidine kinase/response regulator CckA
VTYAAPPARKIVSLAEKIAPKQYVVLTLGVLCLGAALICPEKVLARVLICIGGTLFWLSFFVYLICKMERMRQKRHQASIWSLVKYDRAACFETDEIGSIISENQAAIERFGGLGDTALLHALDALLAAPEQTLMSLQNAALEVGFACEDIFLQKSHMRLNVYMVGQGRFLWRLEELHGARYLQGEGLALPMLRVSAAGDVLFQNQAARDLLGSDFLSFNQVIRDVPLRSGGIHEVYGIKGRILARVAVYEAKDGVREVYFFEDKKPDEKDWDAFDALPVALLRVSLDGSISQSNKPARDILALEDTDGLNFGDTVEGLGRSVVDWVSEAAMGRARKPEFVRASQALNDTFLQVSLKRVEAIDGVELIAVLSDATELKSLEAQFVQSQKMQAIGQLAGGVAHDFNNLLTAISGHCDLLLLRHGEADPEYGDLVQIHQNANRAASLVGQLLAFSRKQTLKPEVIDLRDTLADLTHLLNRLVGEKVSLNFTHEIGLLPIRVDKRQLEQVIMNLVVNARDAMAVGGEIVVATQNEVLTAPLLRDRASVPEGEYVVVRVTDQGQGIPPERLQKIFEPFFTTKRTGEGTGLGLSTAYGIIKQTGGFIFVDSVVGAGTSFSIYLPAHTAQAEAITDTTDCAPVTPQNLLHERGDGVVLLVEDEAPVRAFASRALRLRGYTVIEAESAEDALETLEDETLHVDVFVTDVIMPGMDGPTWVSRALEKRPGINVVFVSGYAEDHFSDQQARIPNSVFLPKPFSLSELTATVHAQMQ